MKSIKGYILFALIALLFTAKISFALPFTIVPNGPLPTIVVAGGSVPASYIVTNNTHSTRSGNFVKYLPPNVTQDTSGVGACGKKFTLGAHNTANDHCFLNLIVSGIVNANDRNPHHHLFVCFPGGATCAGTKVPLNVSSDSLFGVTGEDGNSQHTLFTLNLSTANATRIMTLTENSCCGNIIASDGISLYHWNGHNNPNQIFEKINLQSLTTMAIPLSGATIDEPFGAVYYNSANAFLYSDNSDDFSSVSINGFATRLGNTNSDVRGMACFNHRIYGVNPRSAQLFEINPVNGNTLSTKTITLSGFNVTGAVGLTVHPISGVFYALLKVTSTSLRKLVTLDITTGIATLIGNADDGTGLEFASIAFHPADSNC